MLIWIFEFGVTGFLGVLAWRDIDKAIVYFFLMGLVIVLAIFGNKTFSVKANGVEVTVEDEDKK